MAPGGLAAFFWRRSNLRHIRRSIEVYQHHIEAIHRQLQPTPRPRFTEPEQMYERTIKVGHREEEAQRLMKIQQKINAEELMRWEKGEQKKQDPVFIERMHKAEANSRALIAKLQKDIAKEEANPDWRYKALTHMTKLATQRLLSFVGDAQVERQRGAQITGACFCCGKTLTDKLSLERGIGPECVKYLRTFDLADLVRLKNEMVAAHPDKGGRHEAFLEAYARYAEAKTAAEHSLGY
jgi:hypothetical protein